MNLGMSIAVYAAISKELNLPLRFPGTERTYGTLYQITSAEILAKATTWAGESDAAKNEIFNITNGDYFRWQYLWPRIAAMFDMPAADPVPTPLHVYMADKEPIWDAMVRKYGLQPLRYEQVSSWPFADAILRLMEFDNITSTIKARRAVLVSSLLLLLLFWQWRPMSGIIWHASHSAGRFVLSVLFATGWLIALTTTFWIDHFDLFGLRQVYLHLRRRKFTPIRFTTPGPYQSVRHPLYLGWLFAFWSTPTMTVGHMVFAIATTAYILLAIKFEEKDLISFYGEAYRKFIKERSCGWRDGERNHSEEEGRLIPFYTPIDMT
jgi:protein-S-isoprenylcysteine O-methyltransferase Ste14